MAKWAKRIGALLALLYAGMCTLAKFDGGATKGMPSASAAAAARSGMLVKRLTVIVDSGGPPGAFDAWIELPASTGYRLGVWPYRRPLHYFDTATHYLLSLAVPYERVPLGDGHRGGPTKESLGRGDSAVVAWDIVGPVSDTLTIRARPPDQAYFPVVFSDGRTVADAAPPRP